jgi:hypothetical protein
LKFALAKGHDADIPPNAGVYHSLPEKEAQAGVAVATSSTTDTDNGEEDPNIVDWDKPVDQDPANPINWSEGRSG